jgi:hypothetical protein
VAEEPRLPRPGNPPRTRSALEQQIARYAKFYGVPQNRVRNWVSFMIVAGALERTPNAGTGSAFLIKGGVALELRLRLRSRATRDLDAIYQQGLASLIAAVDAAFAESFSGFTLRRNGDPHAIADKATRIEVRIEYRGKPWGTVPLEVSRGDGPEVEAEQLPATDLSELGLAGPATVACLSARFQIAQKIHAVTAPGRGARPNERYRDLADLWLLRELGPDLQSVREACEAVFAHRAEQPWPPEVHVPPHWAEPFARLAEEIDLPTRDVGEAAAALRAFIAEMAGAR